MRKPIILIYQKAEPKQVAAIFKKKNKRIYITEHSDGSININFRRALNDEEKKLLREEGPKKLASASHRVVESRLDVMVSESGIRLSADTLLNLMHTLESWSRNRRKKSIFE